MSKRMKIVVASAFVLTVISLLVLAVILERKNNNAPESQKILSVPRISVSSEVEGFSPSVDKENLVNLEKYLDTIHFWDMGVVYGKVTVEGTVKPEKLHIVFTPVWRDESKTYGKDKEQLFSRELAIDGELGTLFVYIGKPEIYRITENYVLGELFKIASWPRSQYVFGLEEYEMQRSNFVKNYSSQNRPILQYE